MRKVCADQDYLFYYWVGRKFSITGANAVEVCRKLGISEQTYYRWRREYGGLKVAQAKRLKELEKENARLKRAVADLTLDKLILKETTGQHELAPRFE